MNETQLHNQIQSVLRGNPDAFEPIYLAYIQQVYRYCRGHMANDHDAEDVTAQVFLKVYTLLPRFSPQKSSFRTWVYQISRTVVIDYARSLKSLHELPEDHEVPHKTHFEHQVEARMTVEQILQPLRFDERELCWLRWAEGFSTQEIAGIVGRSEAAVKMHLSRLRTTLRSLESTTV
jgi:RNA polymerase sigma-70 factor (ECF subfamily)